MDLVFAVDLEAREQGLCIASTTNCASNADGGSQPRSGRSSNKKARALPHTRFGQAVSYTLKQRHRLEQFLDLPELQLSKTGWPTLGGNRIAYDRCLENTPERPVDPAPEVKTGVGRTDTLLPSISP